MRARSFPLPARGFSLVELMIALVLGLLVTGALIQLFLANKVTYSVSDGLVRAQESARYAMTTINRDLRMAGAQPICSGAPLDTRSLLQVSDDGDVGAVVVAGGFVGFDYNGTESGNYPFPLDGSGDAGAGQWANFESDGLPPVLVGRALAGTDVFAVAATVPVDGFTGCSSNNANANSLGVCDRDDNNVNHSFQGGDIVTAVDCTAGVADTFVNNTQGQGGPQTLTRAPGATGRGVRNINAGSWSTAFRGQTEFYRTDVVYYFIGESAGSTPERFRPALYRVRNCNDADSCQFEELAEGVENLQVFFRRQGSTALYSPRDNQIGDWRNVTAAELDLVLVSPEPVENRELDQSLQLANGLVVQMADRRIRVTYSHTAAVRNRVVVR